MGDYNIRTQRYLTDMLLVCTGLFIAYEHRHTIEMQAFYLNARIAEIMDMLRESFQLGLVKTIIMVSGNEYFMWIRKFGQPFNKVEYFFFCACQGEIPRMDQHVRIGQGVKLPMQTVRVREV